LAAPPLQVLNLARAGSILEEFAGVLRDKVSVA